MSNIHRTATGVLATLTLATAPPALATPRGPNTRDPSIPNRPALEPAMIASAPLHVGNRPAVVITKNAGVTVKTHTSSTRAVSEHPAGQLRADPNGGRRHIPAGDLRTDRPGRRRHQHARQTRERPRRSQRSA